MANNVHPTGRDGETMSRLAAGLVTMVWRLSGVEVETNRGEKSPVP